MVSKYAVTGSAKESNSKSQYSDIKNALNSLGMTETNINNCDCLIFINYNKKSYKKYKELGKDLSNLVLIRLEPLAIFPAQYRKSVESKFKLIIDPGKLSTLNLESDFLGWPYKYNLNPSTPNSNDPNLDDILSQVIAEGLFDYENWDKRKNKIVLIAANKVSPTFNSNYKLRRKIAKQMTAFEIDVFGDLWNSSLKKKIVHRIVIGLSALKVGYFPNLIELYGSLFTKYKNYRGAPEDKHLIIRKYKYSLVIENSSSYCSEKLFDAVINGSIPIYVGPKNTELFLPDNLYYSCDGSTVEIRKIMNNITSEDVNDRLKIMKKFLVSKKFNENWTSEKVYKQIALRINNFWNLH